MRVFGLEGSICCLAKHPPPDLSSKAQERLRCVTAFEALMRQGMESQEAARVLSISRATLYRWQKRLKRDGTLGLEERSRCPRHRRRPTWSLELVQEVQRLREEYPRWGKDKLAILLRRQGITASVSMIGRIINHLKKSGVLREPPLSRIKRNRQSKPRPYAIRKPKDHGVSNPGDLIQLDTLDIRPLPGLILKHFTAQDTITHWNVVTIRSTASSLTATQFLDEMERRMPFRVKAIQVDGGSEFMAGFEGACQSKGIRLFVLPPRSPKLNGQVERAHRTHIEEFYELYEGDWDQPELGRSLLAWENQYNTFRPHQSLMHLTPLEYLNKSHQKMTLLSHM